MDNNCKKTFLRQIIVIFSISITLIILINCYELFVLEKALKSNQSIIYCTSVLKVLIYGIAYIASIVFGFELFNKAINFDYMTGLYSRRKLFFDLNNLIIRKMKFRLCLIDLNNFKQINDQFGHPAGDKWVIGFSEKIRILNPKLIRGYRYGGDEFVILIKDNIQIDTCIESIIRINGQNVEIQKNNYEPIYFAIGIIENDFVSTAEQLIKKADKLMYENKQDTKSRKI